MQVELSYITKVILKEPRLIVAWIWLLCVLSQAGVCLKAITKNPIFRGIHGIQASSFRQEEQVEFANITKVILKEPRSIIAWI